LASLVNQVRTLSNKARTGILASLLLAAGAIPGGCGRTASPTPAETSLSAPEIQPMLAAMQQVDRTNLGFTPLSTNAHLTLELRPSGTPYDAMLHAYGETSRTIAFRKTPSGYRWIFEQETYEGPGWMQTVDGNFRERLTIQYQTEPVDGIPTNQIHITYTGTNSELQGRQFTLPEARTVLEKWKASPVEPQPPDIAGSDFPDPLPAFLVLIAVLTAVIIAGLILIVAAICAIVLLVLLVAGIISASVLVGYLRGSLSAAFRTLFLQLGALGGMACGALATSVAIAIRNGHWDSPLRWLIGIGLGLVAGILSACIFNYAWSRIARMLVKKLEIGN
jgi:hypothetical protein